MPKRSNLVDSSISAHLLDEQGLPVTLPFDLTVPFARFVSHNKVSQLKRFCVSRVFRRNAAGGQPKGLWECDFDIVSNTDAALNEAEVISFCCEFLESFSPQEFAYTVIVNHTMVMDEAMELCQVETKQKVAVMKIFAKAQRFTAEKISAKLQKDLEMSEKNATLLANVMTLKGPFGSTLTRFRSMMGQNRKALDIYKHLKKLLRFCNAMGVGESLRLDFGMPMNKSRYEGVVFMVQLVRQRQFVAVGGRYDNLLRTFRSQSDSGGVGVSVALEKVVSVFMLSLSNSQKTDKSAQKGPSISEIEILVSDVLESTGNMIDERVSLCKDLWVWGYRADYSHNTSYHTFEDVIKFANKTNLAAVIFLKKSGELKLWLGVDRTSIDLKRSELKEFLRNVVPLPFQRQKMFHSPVQPTLAQQTSSVDHSIKLEQQR